MLKCTYSCQFCASSGERAALLVQVSIELVRILKNFPGSLHNSYFPYIFAPGYKIPAQITSVLRISNLDLPVIVIHYLPNILI